MYDAWYNKIKKWFGKETRLCFTDTDSLLFECSKNPEDVMALHPDLFDTSDYDKSHRLYSPTNKKVIGKFKSMSLYFLL